MNAEMRAVLTDIKAAVRIGHAESLWLAFDGLLELPQAAGNTHLNEAFLRDVVLPTGQTLAYPGLEAALVISLGKAPQALLRAVCAAALAYRYFTTGDVNPEQLHPLACDARRDVRQALVLALVQAGRGQGQRLLELARIWLAHPSPRTQLSALHILQVFPDQAVKMLAQMDASRDQEVQAAMVDTLNLAAHSGYSDEVLALLKTRAQAGESQLWLVCNTLSSSWAAEQAQHTLDILSDLSQQVGAHKQIKKVLKTLLREGAEDAVKRQVQQWAASGEEELVDLYGQLNNDTDHVRRK